jgi:MFS family permease
VFSYVAIGMIIGLLGGGLLVFNLDHTKGWNPYGWWFIATFLLTVFGGFLGMIIYAKTKKKVNE